MFKSITVLAAFCATMACALAGNISGTMTWISGTLAVTVTPKTTAQTVQIKVGSVTTSYPNTMVTGSTAVPIPAGTPFTLLKAGSQPFAANYSAPNVVAFTTEDLGTAANRRTVPMSLTGVITDGIGFPAPSYGTASLYLYFPYFSVGGTLSFRNGMAMSIGTPLTSYSLPLPVGTTTSLGTVTFPVSSVPLNHFTLTASGNGILTFTADGTSNVLWVAGNNQGTATIFTTATFSIGSNLTY